METRKTSEEILKVLNSPVPMSSTQVARYLISKGIFRSRYSNKLGAYLKKKHIADLVSRGLVVEYNRKDREIWEKARGVVRMFSKIKPRRVDSLYQANFVAAFGQDMFSRLPDIDPELNLAAMAFLHKLLKQGFSGNLGLDLLNFLLCDKSSKERNEIRLFMYKQPLDYSEIELLEKILVYGSTLDLPFKPDIEKAKDFIRRIATRNTITRDTMEYRN